MEGIMADPDIPEKGHDRHFAGVLDRNTLEIVATYRSQQDTIPYGRQLLLAARFYGEAWASPEINSCGLAVLNEFKRAKYSRIFHRRTSDETQDVDVTDNLGLRIGALNRKPYLEVVRSALQESILHIYDIEIVKELRSFVNKDGKWQAKRGSNDDSVMMMAGILQLHQQCPMGFSGIDQRDTSDRPNNTRQVLAMNAASGYDNYADLDDPDLDDPELN
jgi:hypothetical protein